MVENGIYFFIALPNKSSPIIKPIAPSPSCVIIGKRRQRTLTIKWVEWTRNWTKNDRLSRTKTPSLMALRKKWVLIYLFLIIFFQKGTRKTSNPTEQTQRSTDEIGVCPTGQRREQGNRPWHVKIELSWPADNNWLVQKVRRAYWKGKFGLEKQFRTFFYFFI